MGSDVRISYYTIMGIIDQVYEDYSEKGKNYSYLDQVIETWKLAYQHIRDDEYIVVNVGKERAAAGKIVALVKKKHILASSDELLEKIYQTFCLALSIDDPWLNDNMDMSIFISKINQIRKQLKDGNTKRRNKKGISPDQLAAFLHSKFEKERGPL